MREWCICFGNNEYQYQHTAPRLSPSNPTCGARLPLVRSSLDTLLSRTIADASCDLSETYRLEKHAESGEDPCREFSYTALPDLIGGFAKL